MSSEQGSEGKPIASRNAGVFPRSSSRTDASTAVTRSEPAATDDHPMAENEPLTPAIDPLDPQNAPKPASACISPRVTHHVENRRNEARPTDAPAPGGCMVGSQVNPVEITGVLG